MKLIRTLILTAVALCASATGAFAQLNTQLKAQLPLGTETNDVWVSGSHAYVARGDEGVSIIDISNPAAPVTRGTFAPVGCHAHDVEVIGNTAYIANHVFNNSGQPVVGLYIADVTDKDNPVEIGRIEWGMGAWYHLGASSYSIHAEDRAGQRLVYIASNIQPEVEIFDVTVPNAAVYIGPVANPVWTFYSQPHEMFVHNNLLFTTWMVGGLTIDDVTDPAAPIRLVHQPCAPNYMWDAKLNAAGTHLITTEAPTSGGILRTWDLTNVASGSITQVGVYSSPNATGLHNIAVQGNYASISSWQDGLRVLNIANPAAPFLAGWYDTNPTQAGPSNVGGYGVAISGENIFLSHSSGGLYVIDHVDTITITKAEWKNSTKTLTVEATSTGSPYLTLTVAGYGTMTWNGSLGRYTLTSVNVARAATVTVTSDIGGSATGSVRKR